MSAVKSIEIVRDKDTTTKVTMGEKVAIVVFMRGVPMGTILLKPEEIRTIYQEMCEEL